ncbi:unnamed protein product [Ixodes persulcatus]
MLLKRSVALVAPVGRSARSTKTPWHSVSGPSTPLRRQKFIAGWWPVAKAAGTAVWWTLANAKQIKEECATESQCSRDPRRASFDRDSAMSTAIEEQRVSGVTVAVATPKKMPSRHLNIGSMMC